MKKYLGRKADRKMHPLPRNRACWLSLGLIVATCPVFALQTFTVDSTLDQVDDNVLDGVCHTAAGTCTLRAAIMQANRSTGAGTMILVPGGVYALTIPASALDEDDSGDLNLGDPTTGNPIIDIVGAGAATIVDANQIDRAFRIQPTRTASFTGLTIRNGFVPSGFGGGIFNQGILAIDQVVVAGNQAQAGGGIFNQGVLIASRASIERNSASEYGGGLASTLGLSSTSSLSLDSSVIAFNSASTDGGGVLIDDVAYTFVDTTIAQNGASRDGGGICVVTSSGNVYNSTIAYNGADTDEDTEGDGGGIHDAPDSITNLYNSLVAGNTVRNSPEPDDCAGQVATHAGNIFGTTDGCTITQVSGSYELLNSLQLLGALQNNGGPTDTVALLAGNNAIDAGDPTFGCLDMNSNPITTDQRGFSRNVGICDLGAFEFGAADPNDAIFADGFD